MVRPATRADALAVAGVLIRVAQRFYRKHDLVLAETTDGSANEEKAPDMRLVWRGSSSST